jgi:hypothetical protein
LLVPLWIWVARTRLNLVNLTKIANAVAVALVMLSIGRIGLYQLQQQQARPTFGQPGAGQPGALLTEQLGYRPDIYYIILDGYGRSDILKSLYGEDNTDFISHLRKRGFYIATQSRANYPETMLSLASSLNMSYLHVPSEGPLSRTFAPATDLILHNQVCALLKRQGYRIVVFASAWEITDTFPADVKMRPVLAVSCFETALAETTIWDGIGRGALGHFGLGFPPPSRTKTLYALENLPRVPRERGPVFVFAHMMVPHPPFVFGRDGEPVTTSSGTLDESGLRQLFVTGYRNQVAYISDRIQGVIDQILSTSSESPVILLQGDHGPRCYLKWDDPRRSNLEDAMDNLNAYYLPGHGRKALYPSISPVNSFRVVFNTCFGANYRLLEDTSYFSNPAHPYDLIELELDTRGKLAVKGDRVAVTVSGIGYKLRRPTKVTK